MTAGNKEIFKVYRLLLYKLIQIWNYEILTPRKRTVTQADT